MTTPEHYRRLEEIFKRVRDSEIEDRPRILKELCGDDATLRREVEALLEHDETDRGVLENVEGAAELSDALGDATLDASTLEDGPADVATMGSLPDAERYLLEKEIGRGGMGQVLLAYDREFRRRIAMKVLPAANDVQRATRFLEEAQATAQLEHPNIAPVYDLGRNATGEPFFTMKWIRGRNLEEIIHAREPEFTQIRLLQILQQVSMGVDFAHSRGVIHRDLKPENIMVGDYGEVQVMDWGIAKIIGSEEDEESRIDEHVQTSRHDTGHSTMDGLVMGSLYYMAPEQARGDVAEISPHTDIFGLGGILYAILTGEAPIEASSFVDGLEHARNANIKRPTQRTPRRDIPAELESICMQALSRDTRDRFSSAREFHDRLQAYVEGTLDAERRAAEAARLFKEAGETLTRLREVEERHDALKKREEELRATLVDHDPAEKKQPLWDLLAELSAVAREVSRLFSATVAAYQAIFTIAPRHRKAHAALARIYFERLESAEARGDREARELYEQLVRQHDARGQEILLRDEAELHFETDPPGAAVALSRYEESGLLLVESTPERLGETPLDKSLPLGSYVAVIEKPGHSPVRYPFMLRRGSRLDACVKLYPEGSIPDGFIQIPGGASIIGGDPELVPALPRQERHIDEFFVARYPVTFEEYCRFLNSAARTEPATGGDPPPERLLPSPAVGGQEFVVRDASGDYVPARDVGLEKTRSFLNTHPIIAIPFDAMKAYCHWLDGQTGLAVRLLSEEEWERCARASDGRVYPWGNGFDWAFCRGGKSSAGNPWPAQVGRYPQDCSPFGVRDLAGGVFELCDDGSDPDHRVLRGGSYMQTDPLSFRSDNRTLVAFDYLLDLGMRVAFSSVGP